MQMNRVIFNIALSKHRYVLQNTIEHNQSLVNTMRLFCLICLQGVSTSRSHAGSTSDSDVRYPTLHKPVAHGSKKVPSTAALADPDSPEVQYPGIYKPNKKTDASKVCKDRSC